jgi:glyoxylase-like metal-dependent hydrolase (beta-lactamase superfamily II)
MPRQQARQQAMPHPEVVTFRDPVTSTATHVLIDPDSDHCAIIDSVFDYEPASGTTDTASVQAVIDYVRGRGLEVDWLLETHVHADHLSAAPLLKEAFDSPLGIGARVRDVQAIFRELFNTEPAFIADGHQFDALFEDGATLSVGGLEGRVLHTPGHTPACLTYVFGDAAFVGDTLFAPWFGTARCDFPGGDARVLFHSIRRILALPPETRIFLCHDYPPEGEAPVLETTVAEERRDNVHVHDGVGEDEFVTMRTERDATLEMPTLILPSVQVNMRAGHLPPPEDNGRRYLKIPINAFERHGGAMRDDDGSTSP